MSLFRRIAVVVAVVAWVALAPAGPASATTGTLPASCSDSGHILNSWAYVSEVGPHHQWHQFQYEIQGDWTRGQSNVNFWVREYDGFLRDSVTVYWNHSPDDLDHGVLYTVVPPWAVYSWGATYERVDYRATFDVAGPDPWCFADTIVV